MGVGAIAYNVQQYPRQEAPNRAWFRRRTVCVFPSAIEGRQPTLLVFLNTLQVTLVRPVFARARKVLKTQPAVTNDKSE